MIWDEFLEARLVVLLGVPFSGVEEIRAQLDSVGLVNHVVDVAALISGYGHGRGAENSLDVLAGHLEPYVRVNERTLVLAEFESINLYEKLLDQLAEYEEWVYLVVVDTSLAGVLSRNAEAVDGHWEPADLERLYTSVSSLDLERIGLPFVMSSSLSLAIDGQDDW